MGFLPNDAKNNLLTAGLKCNAQSSQLVNVNKLAPNYSVYHTHTHTDRNA